LGVPIQFEPRRRQDVDLIFLEADARMGRLLIPQLRFHSLGDIPTYATSGIYQPGANTRDNDLNGIIFPDTPAVLAPDQGTAAIRSELQVYWPQRDGQVRFYGMGFDAYQLVGALYEGDVSGWPLHGMSGDLSVAADGRIHRTLPLGQFRNGRPVALEVELPELREDRELVGFR
jgi:outer membrane PBP1 activator LpoA protein